MLGFYNNCPKRANSHRVLLLAEPVLETDVPPLDKNLVKSVLRREVDVAHDVRRVRRCFWTSHSIIRSQSVSPRCRISLETRLPAASKPSLQRGKMPRLQLFYLQGFAFTLTSPEPVRRTAGPTSPARS